MALMTITSFMTGIKYWVLGKIGAITDLIPSQASSSNKLADKAFVNSSIATATATFRGSYNVVSDLSLSYNATHAQIQTALGSAISTADNNDYAFVQIPTADATPTQIAKIEKYKYNGTAWAFEYELNNSGFTAAQWAAINSGATLELIGKLQALPTNAELTTLLAGKQNVLTFDNVPTQNSDNPVKSGGIYSAIATAISNATNAIKEWANGLFAKTNGWYKQLTAGLAENLVDTKGIGSEQMFTRRTSCGEESIKGDGNALFKKLLGKSLVWNQKASPSGTSTKNGITATRIGNGFVLSGEASASGGLYVYAATPKYSTAHKFCIRCNDWTGSGPDSWGIINGGMDARYFSNTIALSNVSGSTVDIFGFWIKEGYSFGANEPVRYVSVIDLTLMFGAGNEPSTVAEFEAMYNKLYYAYNAGKIIDNMVESYDTVGFNQWDEETKLGYYSSNGEYVSSNNQLCSKNPIRVFPSTAYYFHNVYALKEYDRDMNFIKSSGTLTNKLYTTDANTYYVQIGLGESYGTIYKNDVCINLSWSGYRNGEYEPYWKRSLALGLNSFRVTDGTDIITVNGLKSDGTVYDEIDLERKKYIKRVGSVDMSTLTWVRTDNGGKWGFYMFTAQTGGKISSELLCQRYIFYNGSYINTPDKALSKSSSNNYAYIRDDSYTDAAAFTTAMSGVMLYYELAEPIEYDLVDDWQATCQVADFGTEYAAPTEEVDENGVPKSAPFRAMIKYNDDFVRGLVRMPQTYQSQESMDAFASMLGTALNGTITKTWDSTNSKWTYTFTPNPSNE